MDDEEYRLACITLFGEKQDEGGLEKTPKQKNAEMRLAAMTEKYYPDTFKLGRAGQLQRKANKRYVPVCEAHNGRIPHCKKCKLEKALAEGGEMAAKMQPNPRPTLEYMTRKFPNHVFELVNGVVMRRMAYSLPLRPVCGHNRKLCNCDHCGGENLCFDHRVRFANCAQCNDKLWCEAHGNRKYVCPECPGPGWCADHKKEYAVCFLCDENKGCQKCHVRHKQRDDYCVKCHPDYIVNKQKVSKFSCSVQDALEKELDTPFQHAHFDMVTKRVIGKEYCHESWPLKPLDGAFMYRGELALFEALGTYWHGHPSLQGENGQAMNKTLQKTHKSVFAKTETTMRKVAKLTGMRLFYIWELDYTLRDKAAPVWPLVREFNDKLEW